MVDSRLGRADNARFLERFRYLIVASQLLNTHSYLGQATHPSHDTAFPSPGQPQIYAYTAAGAAGTASTAFFLVWSIHWARGGASTTVGSGRIIVLLIVITLFAIVPYTYMRRQWLRYLRQQSIAEISEFITKAHGFDRAAAGALTLVQEVELVSRGYRVYDIRPDGE